MKEVPDAGYYMLDTRYWRDSGYWTTTNDYIFTITFQLNSDSSRAKS